MGRKKPDNPPPPYRMRISRLTVDKLGVKLYDRVAAVIAELVANSYDADATKVTIRAPMGEWLAEKHAGVKRDKGYTIEVIDNGSGMTPEEVNAFYLVVGAERRNDPRRGDLSKRYKRKVMGRKGVGKLAPLGICERIEIISSGGERQQEGEARGYLTAHFTLVRSRMMKDSDKPYLPKAGVKNGTLQPKAGTTIRMSIFDYRYVPKIDEFDRQLAARFGVKSANWELVLKDSEKTPSAPDSTRTVGDLNIDLKPGTRIDFREVPDDGEGTDPPQYKAYSEDGEEFPALPATFDVDGTQYPVTGWMAYSKAPYRDDLMSGVRVYCRGKFAAQTRIFNMKAGFTGEHDVRSYLVGVLNADWLDEDDDLIRTDRQDILWSHPIGEGFEAWGRKVVRVIGTLTREPMRKAAWDLFSETADFDEKIEAEFPGPHHEAIREKALEIAQTMVKSARLEELEDKNHCNSLFDLAVMLAPHVTLGESLAEAASEGGTTIAAVTNILKIAKFAELSAFGRIAHDRVEVIKKVEGLKDDADTMEEAFQSLIEQTPWLINPQWSPISDNPSLQTLKRRFIEYYKERTGEHIVIYGINSKRLEQRPDKTAGVVIAAQFVLTMQDSAVEIIEVKKPGVGLQNADVDRIVNYYEAMDAFFHQHDKDEVLRGYEKFHVTLVCDGMTLRGAQKIAFDGMRDSGGLTQVSWNTFLTRTRKMHEAFLKEAERQKKNAGKR